MHVAARPERVANAGLPIGGDSFVVGDVDNGDAQSYDATDAPSTSRFRAVMQQSYSKAADFGPWATSCVSNMFTGGGAAFARLCTRLTFGSADGDGAAHNIGVQPGEVWHETGVDARGQQVGMDLSACASSAIAAMAAAAHQSEELRGNRHDEAELRRLRCGGGGGGGGGGGLRGGSAVGVVMSL